MARHDLTFNGGMVISTAQKKFGNSSWLFDGSNDYVSSPDSADWNFGTGDFTIDMQIMFNALPVFPAAQSIISQLSDNSNMWGMQLQDKTLGVYSLEFFALVGGTVQLNYNITFIPVVGTWYHLTICHTGSTWSFFINGVSQSVTVATAGHTMPDISATLDIGGKGYNSNRWFNGYLDEIRISKGIARWTANFTPPDQPYVADQYTVLLCHCEADMLGTGAHSMTTVGTPKMVAAAPTANYGGSLEFNGTTDYVSFPDSNDWAFGADSFTIDGWFNFSSLTAGPSMFAQSSGNTFQSFYHHTALSKLHFSSQLSGSWVIDITASFTPPIGTWCHLALVRYGNSWFIFVNGVSQALTLAAGSYSAALPDVSAALKIGIDAGGGDEFAGKIAGLRISKGLARWTSNFTPPNAPYSKAIGGVDGYTKLMLHFDKGNNSAIFEDSSLTPKNISTSLGAPVQKSDQMMFGRSCGYFNGSSLRVDAHADLALSTGDFTIEFWSRASAEGGYITTLSGSGGGWNIVYLSGQLRIQLRNLGWAFQGGSISLSVWTHIAVVRRSGTVTIYLNGTAAGSFADAGAWDFDTSNRMGIGETTPGGGSGITGYIDELRISKGIARWTSNFTPPTKPYDTPAVDGYTKLLLPMNGTNGSTLFPDKGVTGHTVTANGGAAISTTAYKFNGSAGYLDGSGDNISAPAHADWNFGTGDFTLESWVNRSSTDARVGILAQYNNDASGTIWAFSIQAANYISIVSLLSGVPTCSYRTANLTWDIGVWYHLAVVRSGSNVYIFRDGVSLSLTVVTPITTMQTNSQPLSVGSEGVGAGGAGTDFHGYMQDVRVSKGIARWTTDFAPPVRPYGS